MLAVPDDTVAAPTGGAATPLPCGVPPGDPCKLLLLCALRRLAALGGRGGSGRSLALSGRFKVREKVRLKSNDGAALRSRD